MARTHQKHHSMITLGSRALRGAFLPYPGEPEPQRRSQRSTGAVPRSAALLLVPPPRRRRLRPRGFTAAGPHEVSPGHSAWGAAVAKPLLSREFVVAAE